MKRNVDIEELLKQKKAELAELQTELDMANRTKPIRNYGFDHISSVMPVGYVSDDYSENFIVQGYIERQIASVQADIKRLEKKLPKEVSEQQPCPQ